MPKFKPYRKNQFMLFPISIDDYVPKNHLSIEYLGSGFTSSQNIKKNGFIIKSSIEI